MANRALAVRADASDTMTVTVCTAKCLALGYEYSGVEYSTVSIHSSRFSFVSTYRLIGMLYVCRAERLRPLLNQPRCRLLQCYWIHRIASN